MLRLAPCMCDQGPAAVVNGLGLTRLDAARVRDFAALVAADVPPAHWPQGWFAVSNNVHRPGLLLADLEPREAGLAALFARGAPAVLAEIERAGLRGRGGAGFTTALKWRFCREAPGQHGRADKVIVCNADEGEPGTFKDRVLLSAYADLVFEGMTIAAGIVGAQTGFLYLRGEYRYLLDHLQAVLARRRAGGLLGTHIGAYAGQGGGFSFNIQIHLGAGAYICGEESALIESLGGQSRLHPQAPALPGHHRATSTGPRWWTTVQTFLAARELPSMAGYGSASRARTGSPGSKYLYR
jgi:NADH:ubiquinone oxidoreductase, NADH-binding (51 kD) subunit